MPPLRPLTSRRIKRPTIHEVVTSILTPTQTCLAHARHIHRLSSTPHTPCNPKTSHLYLPPQSSFPSVRNIHFSPPKTYASSPRPKSHDRGPPSSEDTQTDFSTLDVLGGTPVPSTAIDACLWDGFHLNNGVKIVQGAGVLLVGGEAFGWRPWEARARGKGVEKRLLNKKGQWEVDDLAWGLLEVVWPKPDLLILGLGPSMAPLSPATKRFINSLGIRVDIQDTRNASAQFNLLATERGVSSIAAALIPLGWREGVGVK